MTLRIGSRLPSHEPKARFPFIILGVQYSQFVTEIICSFGTLHSSIMLENNGIFLVTRTMPSANAKGYEALNLYKATEALECFGEKVIHP